MDSHVDSAPVALVKVVKRRWYWLIPGIVASFVVPALISEPAHIQKPPTVVEAAAPCTGTPESIAVCQHIRRALAMTEILTQITQDRITVWSGMNLRCMKQFNWRTGVWYIVTCW